MKSFIYNIKKYFNYSLYSAKATLKSEVAGSHLNWVWWILEPICFMLIYTFLVQIVFSAREPYFPVFVLIGLTIWDFFKRMANGSVKLISSNKNIVSKVYLPKYILLISKSLTYLFKFGVSALLIVIVMIIFKVPFTISLLFIIPLIILLYLISFGISSILMHFGVFVEDLSNVVNIVLRLLFYMSGIFYSIGSMVPTPYNEILLNLNPIAFTIDSFRLVVINGQLPNMEILIIWFVIGFILCLIGIKLINKYENSYAKVIS